MGSAGRVASGFWVPSAAFSLSSGTPISTASRIIRAFRRPRLNSLSAAAASSTPIRPQVRAAILSPGPRSKSFSATACLLASTSVSIASPRSPGSLLRGIRSTLRRPATCPSSTSASLPPYLAFAEASVASWAASSPIGFSIAATRSPSVANFPSSPAWRFRSLSSPATMCRRRPS